MLLSFEQLQSIHGIYNPSEQLAYYHTAPEALVLANRTFVKNEIIKLKKDYFMYCHKHGIAIAPAWAEVERDAAKLIAKLKPAVFARTVD